MNLKPVLFNILILSVNLSFVRAETVDPAFEALLKQQVDINEGVQIQQIMSVEFDGRLPGVEQAVLWTIMGSTYWRNQLSILAHQPGHLKLLATIPVVGMASGFRPVMSDGTLQVETKIGGPNDPLCCPTQAKVLYFSYQTGQLSAVMPTTE
ncbi:MAG: hypothetical protein M0R33_16430 [Methylomonas sp.]|jgi:hypothetical protein|uniref:hypothetical protein n=1 Tax=Methylomonas sp. TaxID=418 RepID=UPI0025FD657E|nr:hypothetical protein [Methylomonas sp.]MCK9608030.1 hypothetical protein [Methylomonas sp.]